VGLRIPSYQIEKETFNLNLYKLVADSHATPTYIIFYFIFSFQRDIDRGRH
jgi:hypothetical protein